MKPSPIRPWAKTPAPTSSITTPAKASAMLRQHTCSPSSSSRPLRAHQLQQGGQHQADDDDGDDVELGPSLPSNSSTPMMGVKGQDGVKPGHR